MPYNEFSFLSERIAGGNPETDYALLNFNTTFVHAPQGNDIKEELLLLHFKQRLWHVSQAFENEFITAYYSKFHAQMDENVPFLIHDLIFEDQLKHKHTFDNSINCSPTLSFRTLIYDEQHHIKYGLPIHYGAVIRVNRKDEVLSALYLADYIFNNVRITKLDFFLDYKGFSINGLEDYSVSYRKRESNGSIIPFGCYFNKILNHSNQSPKLALNKTIEFLVSFLIDLNEIYKELWTYGLGLEIHGQNLLIKLTESGIPMRSYLYRDLGTSTLDAQNTARQLDLNAYYLSNYNFEFTQQLPAGYLAWINYRSFLVGFILYNLEDFSKKNNLDFNAYCWFNTQLNKLKHIKSVY